MYLRVWPGPGTEGLGPLPTRVGFVSRNQNVASSVTSTPSVYVMSLTSSQQSTIARGERLSCIAINQRITPPHPLRPTEFYFVRPALSAFVRYYT